MKKIYRFVAQKEETVKESTQETKDDGTEVTITKDVKKKVNYHYFLRKPTRSMYDAAELFYAVSLSEGIKAGLLTRALLLKRFNNDGGILSEDQKEEMADLYQQIYEKQNDFQRLSLKTKAERDEKEQEEYRNTLLFLNEARKELQEFETVQSTLYDQTAENRARNKTILWWLLALSYKSNEEGVDEVPFFNGDSYDEKLAHYDKLEEEDDEFLSSVVAKLSYYVSFWYVSKANTEEEFEELLKMTETNEKSVDEIIEEEAKEEEEWAKEAKQKAEAEKAEEEAKQKAEAEKAKDAERVEEKEEGEEEKPKHTSPFSKNEGEE